MGVYVYANELVRAGHDSKHLDTLTSLILLSP